MTLRHLRLLFHLFSIIYFAISTLVPASSLEIETGICPAIDLARIRLFKENQYSGMLKSNRDIKVLVLPIDFEDLPSHDGDTISLTSMQKSLDSFFGEMSEGNISFKWEIRSKSIHMPRPILLYRANFRSSTGLAEIIKDAQNEMISMGELRAYDYVIFVVPSTSTRRQIAHSLSYLGSSDGIVNSAILGPDFWAAEFPWMIAAHEMGHAFGLLDLYDEQSALDFAQGTGSFRRQFQFMKDFDLMNWPSGRAPAFTMWNRLQISSMLASRFVCIESDTKSFKLQSVNAKRKGVKAILIQVNADKLLVVEVRDAQGFDRRISNGDQGVITYVVDFGTRSGSGPLRLLCGNQSQSREQDCGLKVSQARKIQGVQISVQERFTDGYYVSISFDK